ncbi:MAG: aspartate aminotransferase family protein [Chloroflexi bacterium]|nr:aspartate aminotransferase family protein [Chloroflexota bacterium]
MPITAEDLSHIVLDLRQMKDFCREPLVVERADGVWYWDSAGNRILDCLSGIFVVNVGHNNRRVIEAMKAQLDRLAFSPPLHATNPPAVELAKLVAEITPGDLNTIKLLSGGSEATEAAMKLARQYHRQTGNPWKYKVIARYLGYHGATMGALGATGTAKRKVVFEPALEGFLHVPPPTCFRCPYGLCYPGCDILCARAFETVIEGEGSSSVSSVILEPIGNTGGIVTPPAEYLPIVRDICDRHQVLLIFDEIITGFGRTGQMFAAQTFGVTPDILCMGKGMSSGYAPLAAIAFGDRVAAAFWGEEGTEFAHGHTFGGNPLSSTAGLVSIREIIDRDLCRRARAVGAYLRQRLAHIEALGVVGEIRGKGLLLGIEFVRDLATKAQFDNRFGVCVGKRALQKGLLLRFDPHWIAFAPPLIITEEQIDLAVEILADSIREELRERGL